MSRGRQLQAGDKATTDWNGEKTVTHVTIVRRVDGYSSGSGIAFQVKPRLKNGLDSSLYDADWFEPLPPNDKDQRAAKPSAASASSASGAVAKGLR